MPTAAQRHARIARAKKHQILDRLLPIWLPEHPVCCDAVALLGPACAKNTDSTDFFAIVAAHDGTAEWLERLRSRVFERWVDVRRFGWDLAFAEALPVGVDLALLYHRMCLGFLDVPRPFHAIWPTSCRETVIELIDRTCELHRLGMLGGVAWEDCGDLRIYGETIWMEAEAARKAAFDLSPAEEAWMTAAECGAESAWNAVSCAVWSIWSPALELVDEPSLDWRRARAGSTGQWGAAQCADHAVWSAGFGAAAQNPAPPDWPLDFPAWAGVAEFVLHTLSAADSARRAEPA